MIQNYFIIDVDWYWIVRTDGQEGFVPSAFVYPAENILQAQDTLAGNIPNNVTTSNNLNNNGNLFSLNNSNNNINNNTQFNATSASFLNNNNQQQPQIQNEFSSQDDLRYHGTELVMLYDYKAQAPDDLSVRRGELIYADLNNQTVDGWLWCYAPKASKKCGKYGFIPKSYTHTYNRQNTSV